MALRTLLRPAGAVIEPGNYTVRICGPNPDVARRDRKKLIGTDTRVDLSDGRYVFFRIREACQSSASNTLALGGYTESGQRLIVLWNYMSDCCSAARFSDPPAIPHQPLSA